MLALGESYTANYSYSANRRVSFGTTSSMSRLSSLSNDVGGTGNYKTFFASGSGNYCLTRSLGLTGLLYYRHLDLPVGGATVRNSVRLSLGLVWSPGEFGLPVF